MNAEQEIRLTLTGNKATREAFLAFLRSKAAEADNLGLRVRVDDTQASNPEHAVEFNSAGSHE